MLPSDIDLISITGEQRGTASALDICRRLTDRDEGSDPYQFNGKPVSAVSGECLKLDMDLEEDRSSYADLMAKAVVNPSDVIILWEERVKKEEGGLIIYLCYVSKIKTVSGVLK